MNTINKNAFTLSEVLIAIMIIGLVAILTIPNMALPLKSYVIEKQHDLFKKKFTEGLRQMRIADKLSYPLTTAEFVGEMQKYFRIEHVCSPNRITNCFADKVSKKNVAGEVVTFEVTNFKKASDMNTEYEESDVYGLKFSDGTNMLISYIPDCQISESEDVAQEYNALTKCLRFIYDINAEKSPNMIGIGSDIAARQVELQNETYGLNFKIAAIAVPTNSACPSADYDGTNEAGYCYLPSSLESSDVVSKYQLGTQSKYPNDYWGGAMKYCKDRGYKLPDAGQLSQIAEKIYENAGCTKGTQYNKPKYTNCTIPAAVTSNPLFLKLNGGSDVYLWSETPAGNGNAYIRSLTSVSSGYTGPIRSNKYIVICVK